MKAVVFADTRSVMVDEVSDAVVEEPTDLVVRVTSRAIYGTDLHMYEGFGAAYGYAGMGPYRGAQAELLRVPFADANCIRVPGDLGDDREDDFVLLADAFVTGWHATELAVVRAGCTVAVFGAGAVGLLAAYSVPLKGAAEVYVVDGVPERLNKAGELGATPVDYTHDRRYTTLLRDLIVSGRARPGVIVTHHGHPDDAAALCKQFDQRANGVIKAVLCPS